ncbi:hypothetical protein H696_00625 [Fonticula alba]|uniref:arginine--tRNA ligase n=1 Tax=Fonticula alba TaxID=691883 RepID=A0A058ZFB7_FONAL|nr:hypothetical protein H696_00625 [Fonticula alba]KCV73080.1 hypothetical protein H696_00625 [Fonticula alba]|eukprot:XP_009492781.1 hypothetical protein H696_00625 [Fonticula alba]
MRHSLGQSGAGFIETVTAAGPYLNFRLNERRMLAEVITSVAEQGSMFGHSPQLLDSLVLLEFSSPNIAKPFHMGHLRSTIIGNILSNLYRSQGHQVLNINYLGDWGTQYGILALGFEHFGCREKLQEDPIRHLFQVYVASQAQVAKCPDFAAQARRYFSTMERVAALLADRCGVSVDAWDPDASDLAATLRQAAAEGEHLTEADLADGLRALRLWQLFRSQSIVSYERVYGDLGVSFHSYEGESQSQAVVPRVLEHFQQQGLLRESDGALVVDVPPAKNSHPGPDGADPPPQVAVLQKADGASIYLSRDLATIMRRYASHTFDRLVYVAGSEQELHFQQLFQLAGLLPGLPSDLPSRLEHISFGRVAGMSTREGTAVFLEDVLAEARRQCLAREEWGSRGPPDAATVAMLGLSSVVVADLTSRRIKNYNFCWAKATDPKGDTGMLLQYTHARLCGIERTNTNLLESGAFSPGQDLGQYRLPDDVEVPECAVQLAMEVSRFPEVLRMSLASSEPSILVQYLLGLCRCIGTAHQELKVKDAPAAEAQWRFDLFRASRATLSNGILLLGLTPVERV